MTTAVTLTTGEIRLPATGLDWAWGTPPEKSLHDAGITFCCRYLSSADPSKCITAAEAARHLAAGRAIVLVYEDGARSMLRGRSGGITDATAAEAQARAAGLGGGIIYFAADWDVTPAQQALVHGYLDGAASVIGRAATGIYGGYWPVSRARAAAKAAWYWGTRAWSGSNWESCEWKPHIMQGAGTSVGGVSCDWDTAWAADYGQHPRPGQPPQNWTEALMDALPTLAQGARDTAGQTRFVHRLQALAGGIGRWNALGDVTQVTQDGDFGPATAAAVKAVQGFFGLAQDAVCGPATWAALIAGQRS